jgi:hypothetical protein
MSRNAEGKGPGTGKDAGKATGDKANETAKEKETEAETEAGEERGAAEKAQPDPVRRGLRRSRPIPEITDVEPTTEKRRRFFTRPLSGESGIQSASGLRRRWRWFRPRSESRPPSDLTDTEARAEAAKSAAAELRSRLKEGEKKRPRRTASLPPPIPGSGTSTRAGSGATSSSGPVTGPLPRAGTSPGSGTSIGAAPPVASRGPATGPLTISRPPSPAGGATPPGAPAHESGGPVPENAEAPPGLGPRTPTATERPPFAPGPGDARAGARLPPPFPAPGAIAPSRPSSRSGPPPLPRPSSASDAEPAARTPQPAAEPEARPAAPPPRGPVLRRWRRPLTELSRPLAWQRHDLLVIAIALAVFAIGAAAQRRLAAPSLLAMDQLGLRLSRPSGWLPPRRVGRPVVGLAARTDAADTGDAGLPDPDDPALAALPYHILIQSAVDPIARLEIRIAERPTTGNLRSALVLQRVSRHGEAHWAAESTDRTIGGRDWVRTEFRYTYKGSKTDAPRIASGIEYATINGRLLYTVTVHGSDETARRLEALLVPTLAVDANHPAAVGGETP